MAALAVGVVGFYAADQAIHFALVGRHTASLVALAVSTVWMAAAVAVLAVGFGGRRLRAQTDDYVVKRTVHQLEDILNNGAENTDARKAEALDRLDRLAMRALENRSR